MLQFHWSTLVFQIINFFILLAVLTRFFYRPLQAVMKRQEQEVTARLRDAEERARMADAERTQLAEAAKQQRAEAEALMTKTRAEAAQEGKHIVEQARATADRLSEDAKQRIQELERSAQQRMATAVRQSAVHIATRLIQAAGSQPMHEALLDKLFREGIPLSGDHQELLTRAYAQANGGITIEMAFPPSPDDEERLRQIVAKAVGTEMQPLRIVYQTESSLIAGVRVLIGTMVVDLSLSRTLSALSQSPALHQEEL